ncbi:hypothetical protein AJ80_04373 [Polytolypa hystricis UAMH7299]|uniref:Epoxide hydrolase N-terminal domain-containing protein n=1 Tax=Polytolypa hystricis (strain UAMH7299) TaxID=1447883 RepID=A0A2B7YBY9_POLH7|nr:hypothetical protein AJ80_04373 [Polytolypa hystricis UAMH7299]
MAPQPFKISIPDSQIQDLQTRLSLAKFPTELDDAGWDYGAPLADIKRLTAYWREKFDWRQVEARLNELPQFTAEIEVDGGFGRSKVHFVHQRSRVENAVPLLFVHGWPGSFIEVSKIISDLAKGGEGDSPSFHVVAISLPNYTFSEGSKKRGFGSAQYAETANKLMLQLGYDQYVTQGGDWGYVISRVLGKNHPEHCVASHLNMAGSVKPTWTKTPLLALRNALTPYSQGDKAGVARSEWFMKEGSGYWALQTTKPQTIGYALHDSPVALLAWIYEKLHDWTDEYPWTEEEVCTWVSLYWFSSEGPAASVRIYYEFMHAGDPSITLGWIPRVKLGISRFPKELRVMPNTWAHTMGSVVFQADHPSGGHFAAWERPEAIVGDVRKMFGKKGGAYNVVKGKDGYASPSSRL